MLRFLTCLGCYTAAIVLIYCGVELMDGADWPHTAVQLNGAIMATIGCCAKLAGHIALLGAKN